MGWGVGSDGFRNASVVLRRMDFTRLPQDSPQIGCLARSEPCGQEFYPISHFFRRKTADQPHKSPKLFAG